MRIRHRLVVPLLLGACAAPPVPAEPVGEPEPVAPAPQAVAVPPTPAPTPTPTAPPERGFDPSPDDRPSLGAPGFTGTRKVRLDDGTETAGPILAGARPGSGLEAAGGKAGDAIVAIGGWTIPSGSVDPIGAFRERLYTLPPDSETDLVVHREGTGLVTLRVLLGRQPAPYARLATPAAWFTSDAVDPAIQARIDAAVALDGDAGRARFEDVLARNRRHLSTRDALRLAETTQAHMNVAAQERLATRITDGIRAHESAASALAAGVAGTAPPPSTVVRAEFVLDDRTEVLADQIAADIARIDATARAAFAAWTDEDRVFVKANFAQLTERVAMGEYLYDDEKPSRERANRRTIALLAKVDRARLAEAKSMTRALIAASFYELRHATADRDGLVAARDTPAGRIEIWGGGDQRHTTRCAFRFDSAGDDQYLDCAARADLDHPVSISIDGSGDDLWSGSADFGVCGALGGIALLHDYSGDDIYTARDWGLGAAAAGVASLIDVSGDDTYRAQHFGQGIGLCGAGVLVDGSGQDMYTAARFGQGVGLPGGVGALVDLRGNDRYACTGRYESDYGDAGNFSGWGQGCGFGFRGLASGGIGALFDGAGDDVYEAGTFSQGGGYFYAWGILRDDAGNDRYIGSRYAQGWAAHEAVGTFLEGAGDDVYRSVHDVAQGLSWDETSVFFRDRAGNDRYTTNAGFSLASAAHNGIVVFIDDAGDDVYAGTPAHAASNTYHGGWSFALFLDLAGKDVYGAAKPEETNGKTTRRDDGAFSIDE